MTPKAFHVADAVPHRVDAIEIGEAPRDGARLATLGQTITLSIEGLKDFFFADWRPELIDLLVIAAAVEYCDLSVRRPSWGWARSSTYSSPSTRMSNGAQLSSVMRSKRRSLS